MTETRKIPPRTPLEETFDYKNQLMADLLSHPSITHLINEDIPFERANELAYTQIFPYEYIPEITDDGTTYVCFEVDIYGVDNKTYLTPTLYIWVISHNSIMRLPGGGVRTDRLCSEIDKVVNGSRYYTLGEMNLYSVKRFAPMTGYNGKVMTFQAREWNRQYDGRRSTPSNRRLENGRTQPPV